MSHRHEQRRAERERRLQSVLARNGGAADRATLLDAGLAPSHIDEFVAVGRVHVRHAGVYVDPALVGSPRTETAAAVLASAGLVSHVSAAAALGYRIELPARPDVSVVRSGVSRLRGVTVHRPRDLALARRRRADGFWVTDAHRTALDLGAVIDDDNAYADLLGNAKGRRLICIPGLWFTLQAHARKGRTGVGALRRYLSDPSVTLPTPDALEARLARVLAGAGVGPIDVERVLTDDGEFLGRVDAYVVRHDLPVEADGWEVHGTPSGLEDDLRRQSRLVIAGRAPLRYTWRTVYERPSQIRADVRAAVRSAA